MPLLVAGFLAGILPVACASAKVIKVPEAKPRVLFDAPDDWSLEKRDGHLLLRSPDKTSQVVIGLVKRNKNDVAAWQKAATQMMIDNGVSFDKNAKKPSAANSSSTFSTVSSEPKSVFSGTPSTETPEKAPGVETSSQDKTMAGLSLEQLTGKAPMDHPLLRFHSAALYGGSIDGKPVDVQFLNFALAKDEAFLMQQESPPDDNRINLIVNSVRPAQ